VINESELIEIEIEGDAPEGGWCSLCALLDECNQCIYTPCSSSERLDGLDVYFVKR